MTAIFTFQKNVAQKLIASLRYLLDDIFLKNSKEFII